MSAISGRTGFLIALLFSGLAVPVQSEAPVVPPVAAKHPVSDEYHDVTVVDDYRWLENGKSAETEQWLAAENEYSMQYFRDTSSREAILQDLKAPKEKPGPERFRLNFRAGRFFYLQIDSAVQQQAVLMTSRGLGTPLSQPADLRAVIDPGILDSSGRTSIDWYQPSLDGSLIAVGLAVGGSEREALTVFDTATGKQVDAAFVPMGFPAQSRTVAWLPENKSFLYAGYERAVAASAKTTVLQNEKVFEHILGTPQSEDRIVLEKGLTRLAQIALDSDPAGKWIVASAEDGDGGRYANYVRLQDKSWTQISTYDDQVVAITPGAPEEDALYLTSLQNAPRGKILKLPAGTQVLAQAKTIIPQTAVSIEHDDPESDRHRVLATKTRLYVTTIDGGPNRVRIYDHQGKDLGEVQLDAASAVPGMVSLGGDSLAIRTNGYLTPPAFLTYAGVINAKPEATAVIEPADKMLAPYVVDRAFATSKDGTKIPMSILHRRGSAMDGTVPTLVYGYGGYGISLSPYFVGGARWQPWLEQGYTLVFTNLRGGAEYGESWHTAGSLTKKQNVFDDFSACAQYLADHHWSSRDHMAALGGSNGGLLMGAEITQHPQQFRAIISIVGIYDMLRAELDANGEFNTTEYGTVKDPAQFRALHAYSPYHHVIEGTQYPAVLMETGDNDPRVNPGQSRKFTARLQAANSSGHPILLKTFADAGHGASSTNDLEQQSADIYAFLFRELKVTFPSPP